MANIDDELAFLRDAAESDGNISREAIVNALTVINNERAYPPNVLNVSNNGTYESDEDNPYTDVKVQVGEYGRNYFDGIANVFEIDENGTYYAYDLFGKHMLITEFIVNVPEYYDLKDQTVLNITENGVYESLDNECYGLVNVNIPNVPEPGEYVTAIFGFLDPINPNVEAITYIYTDDHILMGESAVEFLSRFPKLKTIKESSNSYYIHNNWNPNPEHMSTNQLFIPTWNNVTVPPDIERSVDSDIFLYIVQNNLINYFFDISESYENPIKVLDRSSGIEFVLYFVSNGITDASGVKTKACFAISTEKIIESTIYHPRYCDDTDVSDINTETPIDGDNYYWFGCSLVRAFANHDRTLLRRAADISKYDEYESVGYDIESLLPSDIYNAIVPVSHYVIHPERVSTEDDFYFKPVPRDGISYEPMDSYYRVYDEDIPVDPSTGNRSPKYGGLYEALYNRLGEFIRIQLTPDITIVSGKKYYDIRNGYRIIVNEPYISDIFPDNESKQKTGWSIPEYNLIHSDSLFISQESPNNYKAYKYQNGVYTEYTGQDHMDYIYMHYSDVMEYYYYQGIDALRDKIYAEEELESRPTLEMAKVRVIYDNDTVSRYYIYRDIYPCVIYKFDIGTNYNYAYQHTIRYSEEDADTTIIDNILQKINQNDYYRPLLINSTIKHGYINTGDILPDEVYTQYATGNYFDNEQVESIYDLPFPLDISEYVFYNYNDIKDGMNTCPTPYHFERYFNESTHKYDYKIVKNNPTEYSGFASTNVALQVRHRVDSLQDKFLLDYEGIGFEKKYVIDDTFNNINMPLVNNAVSVKKAISHDIASIGKIDISNVGDYDHHTFINGYDRGLDELSTDRNINRYIYADKKTEEYFQEAYEAYTSRPDINEMPTYEDTQSKWQYYYDNFETLTAGKYEMYWPYEDVYIYPETVRKSKIFEYLYFFL